MKREATQNELDFINQAIALKNDDIHLLEVGYFEAGYDFEDLPAYEAALRRIREDQKQMLRMDGSEGGRSAAAFCTETIRFNESVSQGRSMIKKILKLMLRAFNGESPSARKDDASPTRPHPTTRGLDGAEQCVVTARRSKLM